MASSLFKVDDECGGPWLNYILFKDHLKEA